MVMADTQVTAPATETADDVLSRLVPDTGRSVADAQDAGNRAANTPAAPKPGDPPAGDKPPEAKKPEVKEQPKADEKPAPSQKDLSRAMGALLRDGWTMARLLKLKDEDAAEFVEIGTAAAERQAEVSRKLQERAETSKAPDAQPAETPVSAFDIKATLGTIKQDLSEPAQAALDSLITHLSDRVQAAEKSSQEHGSRLTAIQADSLSTRLGMIQNDLRAEYPQVDDPVAWQSIVNKADQLARGGGYATPKDAVNDAAALLYSKVNLETRAHERARQHAERDAGQPSAPSGSGAQQPDKKLTPEEEEDRVLAELIPG